MRVGADDDRVKWLPLICALLLISSVVATDSGNGTSLTQDALLQRPLGRMAGLVQWITFVVFMVMSCFVGAHLQRKKVANDMSSMSELFARTRDGRLIPRQGSVAAVASNAPSAT